MPSHRLTVRAGGMRLALAGSGVAEVIRPPRMTRVPNGPPGLLGIMPLRGTVLPVLSLRQLLDAAAPVDAPVEASVEASVERIVVLRHDPPLGLAVDAVESFLALDGPAPPVQARLLLEDGEDAEALDLAAILRARFAMTARAARGRAAPGLQVGTGPAAPARRDQAFLAFTLAGQDFALPLDSVAEVLALPGFIAALPQTEEILLGVFTLRDAVLPALSLRLLLGLPHRPPTGREQVVVTQVVGQRMALVVDRISTILRVAPDRLGPAPSLFNTGGGEARIDRVLRQADGRGVVAILSPAGLLADDRVAAQLAAVDQQKDESMATAASPLAVARERLLVIRLGSESYGLPIGAVDEVVRRPDTLVRLPKAPDYVRGLLNLRGRVIPVIDQRRRFGLAGDSEAAERIIVLTLGGLQAGFTVDAVTEILEVAAEDILPAPQLAGTGAGQFDRAIERDGRVILLIDPAALLNQAEADLLRDLAASPSTA
ncbi:chemotaxis protein CheW [Falsiroseomonas tokyonensis]|uniref:Chemotaxis protein CheW n=1 Tax=Falsiroseomonas tokyonensis TaxID=430521 RepID=A0ABV7C0L2_9PROT|nr:chemotaxis protein CheW [Falsiroseomonas tokyonensis]